jgi:hypothetical protein
MQPEQSPPAEGREGTRQVANGKISGLGQIDLVDSPGQLGQVVGALLQRL